MSSINDHRSDQLAAAAPSAEAGLDELQTWMTGLIGHGHAIHRHAGLSAAAALHFCGNQRLSPAEQINIYRVQFWLRHTAVLHEHFEGLSLLLGQERWRALAQSYLERADTSVLSLADLGHKMADHIEELPAFDDQRLCVDMARVEWAYQCAFSAFDDPALARETLQRIPAGAWASARFTLADSLTLLELNFPVADLRRQLLTGGPLDRSRLGKPLELNLAVYRRDRVIYDQPLSKPAFSLLQELGRGLALIPACEAVMAHLPEAEEAFERHLQEWFGLWGRLGWIVDVRVEN